MRADRLKHITVRVTDDERAAIAKIEAATGLSVSDLVRSKLLLEPLQPGFTEAHGFSIEFVEDGVYFKRGELAYGVSNQDDSGAAFCMALKTILNGFVR